MTSRPPHQCGPHVAAGTGRCSARGFTLAFAVGAALMAAALIAVLVWLRPNDVDVTDSAQELDVTRRAGELHPHAGGATA